MAGRTPEEAVDAALSRYRTTLACLTDCVTFGSGAAVGFPHVLTDFATGSAEANLLRLPTHAMTGEMHFRFVHRYHVTHAPHDELREPYTTQTISYQYRLSDIAEHDLAVYDWHPDGKSSVTTPHLHVLCAEPIQMAQRPGSPREGVKTHLGKVHFPTRHIFLEDIAEMIIRDFAVVPARSDWQAVLQRNREASS